MVVEMKKVRRHNWREAGSWLALKAGHVAAAGRTEKAARLTAAVRVESVSDAPSRTEDD
jgi:hypothetical protein